MGEWFERVKNHRCAGISHAPRAPPDVESHTRAIRGRVSVFTLMIRGDWLHQHGVVLVLVRVALPRSACFAVEGQVAL